MIRPLRRLAERTPLRVTLVSSMLVLVALALAAIGTVAPMALRNYLVDRTDDQLHRFAEAAIDQLQRGGYNNIRDAPEGHLYISASSFFIRYAQVGIIDVNRMTTPRGSSQTAPDLPTWTADDLTRLDDRPFTVHPVGRGYAWRVLVLELPDGINVTVAVTLDDVDHTVNELAFVEFVVGAITLALLAVVGYVMVRASLRRLAEVERTAQAIAAGDLALRVPGADPRTEVGRLAAAFNTMLAEIESAFAARAASEWAARASEAKMRRFVADASHELRTPLTSIRGFAELHRQSGAEARYVIERIERHAMRMSVLVDDLLLLARLDQQRPLERAEVDLLALAADAVSDAAATAPDHRVQIRVAPGLPAVVVGDEPGLRQVVGNLLSNAIRHTPAGTEITVGVSTEEGYAVLEVGDTGPGMADEDAARVFERFFRTDPSRTRERGGSGLGLAIVDALVKAHHGTITLATAPGAGATFTVRLPLASQRSPSEVQA